MLWRVFQAERWAMWEVVPCSSPTPVTESWDACPRSASGDETCPRCNGCCGPQASARWHRWRLQDRVHPVR